MPLQLADGVNREGIEEHGGGADCESVAEHTIECGCCFDSYSFVC